MAFNKVGIMGLLSADDNRVNYYLDSDCNDSLNSKGFLYDANNKLVFIKSAIRLDDIKSTKKVDYCNCLDSNAAILFIHYHNFIRTKHFKTVVRIISKLNKKKFLKLFPQSLVY